MQDVKINVGVMILTDGRSSIKRGATLPLTVLPLITRNKLLMKAFEKHSRFNNNLVNGEVSQYRLMYPTANQVLHLPGTEELFSLQRYKEEIDKPYSRITLFLCSSTDFMENLMNDSSSDDDLVNSSSVSCNETNSSTNTASNSAPLLTIEDGNTTELHADYTPVPPASKGIIQCPICLNNYPFDEIENHADGCSMWLLEDIDELPSNEIPATSRDSTMAIANVENVSTADLKKHIKKEISNIVATEMSNEDPKRLTVRRKFIWQDFKTARQRTISTYKKIKVVFSGGPSVDERGPRRELFMGIFHCLFFKIDLLSTSVSNVRL